MEGNPLRQPISELSRSEVDKISAGEVVERPLNVVKELIENSLDAGATAITVELEDGGKQLVRVSDNGSGIPAAEVTLALKPHHTSKIRSLDDIYRLSTMGFRGEALGSIAAVSRLKITSRSAGEELGALIEAAAGEVVASAPAGGQPGTEIEVRDLFFNTPVRLKFLRSKQSETGQVSRIITSYALANPEVSWRLESSGRTLISTSGCSTLREVVAKLLGAELAGAMQDIDFEFPPSAVRGLISPPHHFLHNRTRQWYFINNRPVVNKLLYKAVDDAVREFVSAHKHPAGIFKIEMAPEEIDVNVHPMKTEVSFSQPQSVYSLLNTAIRRTIGSAGSQRQRQLTHGLSRVLKPAEDRSGGPPADNRTPDSSGTFTDNQLRLIAGSQQSEPALPTPRKFVTSAEPHSAPAPTVAAGGVSISPTGETVRIAQVGGSYLVATTLDAVYLIDQHEAHERILFETLYSNLRQDDLIRRRAQQLLFNLVVELSPDEVEVAGSYLDALGAAGFSAELTPAGCLAVSAIPAVLRGRADSAMIHGMLDDLSENGVSTVLEERLKSVAAVIACRSAVKGNDALTVAEREDLVLRLLESDSSLSCPHGSPTVIRLGIEELRRMFIR